MVVEPIYLDSPKIPIIPPALRAQVVSYESRNPYQSAIDRLVSRWDCEWFPVSSPLKIPILEERFREEAEIWDRETVHQSSTLKMVLHPSYQKIMAMGPDVVPLLLHDLQENRRSWFWALRHLTDANPVPSEDQGNLDKMIASWIAWGKREGRI